MPPPLMQFQKEGVKMLVELDGNGLLYDDAGLGKTCQTLTYAGLYQDWLRPMLIICPASLKYNWHDECKIWLKPTETIHIVDDVVTPEEKAKVKNADITIINYDRLFNRQVKAKDDSYKEALKIEKANSKQSWTEFLLECNFRFCVCDESQYISNPFAERTKEVLKLGRKIMHKVLLSATPVENHPANLWTSLHMIDPARFPNYHDFARTYSTPKKDFSGKMVYEGGRRLNELNNILSLYMIRRKLVDVLPDMPELIKSVIPVQIEDFKRYEKGYNSFKSISQHSLSEKGTYAKGLAALEEMRQAVAKGKLKSVYEYVDNFLETTNEKILIFAYHKEIVSAIENRYKDKCVKIVGGMSAEAKNENKIKLQTNDNVRILVGNIKSAGVGLTLTRSCYTLFVEFLYNPSWIYQALKRNHRIGQKKTVFANFMVARGTIEEKILKILDIKAEIASQALDDEEMSDKDLLTYLLKVA